MILVNGRRTPNDRIVKTTQRASVYRIDQLVGEYERDNRHGTNLYANAPLLKMLKVIKLTKPNLKIRVERTRKGKVANRGSVFECLVKSPFTKDNEVVCKAEKTAVDLKVIKPAFGLKTGDYEVKYTSGKSNGSPFSKTAKPSELVIIYDIYGLELRTKANTETDKTGHVLYNQKTRGTHLTALAEYFGLR